MYELFISYQCCLQYRISSQFVNPGGVTTRGLMVMHIPSGKVSK